mgnify:CR=1 FL=1
MFTLIGILKSRKAFLKAMQTTATSENDDNSGELKTLGATKKAVSNDDEMRNKLEVDREELDAEIAAEAESHKKKHMESLDVMCKNVTVYPFCNAGATNQSRPFCDECNNSKPDKFNCTIRMDEKKGKKSQKGVTGLDEVCLMPQTMPGLKHMRNCVQINVDAYKTLTEIIRKCQSMNECHFIFVEPFRIHFCSNELLTTYFIPNECSLLINVKDMC